VGFWLAHPKDAMTTVTRASKRSDFIAPGSRRMPEPAANYSLRTADKARRCACRLQPRSLEQTATMEASTLNCPMCGAPATSDATACGHCGARLATVACPSCFGMIFLGSKFCPHCGAKVDRAAENDTALPCPRCRQPLAAIALGATKAMECPWCSGLWIDTATFNQICQDREKQADVIREDLPPLPPGLADFSLDAVRYVPCPVCKKLMNRVNFAHCSGVILDICKGDGVWFDRDELRRIVEFIRAGGLETARTRDIELWNSEKKRKTPGFGSTVTGSAIDGPRDTLEDLVNTGSWLGEALHIVARLFLK
jgi:Zn-finger nucleic acid-binding protein